MGGLVGLSRDGVLCQRALSACDEALALYQPPAQPQQQQPQQQVHSHLHPLTPPSRPLEEGRLMWDGYKSSSPPSISKRKLLAFATLTY